MVTDQTDDDIFEDNVTMQLISLLLPEKTMTKMMTKAEKPTQLLGCLE